jgi:hypothetical protein
MPLGTQVAWLFVLAIPVACVSWTVTHEEVFREPREFCAKRSEQCRRWYQKKFFYLFTCEYCFSHYVSAVMLLITGYTLLLPGWRGLLIAWLALVWVANQYLGVFNRLRLDIKDERINIQVKEEQLDRPSPEST